MRNMKSLMVGLGGALVAMLLSGTPAKAQSFEGQWTASVQVNGMACTVWLVMDPGRYSELLRCGPYMTMQSGTYLYQNGVLVRTVNDWEPKDRVLVGPGGSTQRYENAKPPGGTFRVTFLSVDAMNWYDVNFHGNLTYYRTR